MSEKGKRYWWMVVVVLVAVAAWGGHYLYWQIKFDQTEKVMLSDKESAAERLGPPKEMSTEFDPTETVAVYQVSGLGEESGQVKLQYIVPKTMVGKEIAPILACPAWDNKVFEAGSRVPRYVSAKEMLEVIARNPSAQLLLSGKCSDGGCTSLDRECSLTITPERMKP